MLLIFRYGGFALGMEFDSVPAEFGESAPSEFRKIAVRNVAKVRSIHAITCFCPYFSICFFLVVLNFCNFAFSNSWYSAFVCQRSKHSISENFKKEKQNLVIKCGSKKKRTKDRRPM